MYRRASVWALMGFLALALIAGSTGAAVRAASHSDTQTSTKASQGAPTTLPPIPPGVENHFSFGLYNYDIGTIPSGAGTEWRYQYLTGGVNTGNGWWDWNPNGSYVTNYIAETTAAGMRPAFIYYQITESDPNYDDLQNLLVNSTMSDWFLDFKRLMQVSAGSTPVLINMEPDMLGDWEQAATNGDPTTVPAHVASSGFPEAQGYPNNALGVMQVFAHLRDLYAPNVVLGLDISNWGPGDDITIALRNDPNYDWMSHATALGNFLAACGQVNSGPGYQILFYSPLDRDAAFYQIQYGSSRWWDTNNVTEPTFNTMGDWLGQIVNVAQRRVMMWQVPNGNRLYRSEDNSDGHYQDNRTEYFLDSATGRAHITDWANRGVVGLMFGAGAGGQSHYWDAAGDGITNPPPINGNNLVATVADDDGGYMRLGIAAYYAGGTIPLPGGNPNPTPTLPGPTNTPVPTQTPGGPTATPTPCAANFSDVHPSDYFYEAVGYLYCNGAISGYSDGTFRPYNNTTRGQLSKIVVLAAGLPINTQGGPHFSDVGTASAFYQYVETAYNAGIISGYSNGTFRPNNNVTRGQLSKIVVAAMSWPIDTTGGPHFTDVPASNPFYDYIETAYNHGIISGYSDGTFRPSTNATRGQISKIVYNAVTQP